MINSRSSRILVALLALLPFGARAEMQFTQHILFEVKCGIAIKAAIAFSNNDENSIFRDDEKAAVYAFLLGVGSNDPRDATRKEAFGRGIGAAAFFCERNPDVSIFEIGRLVGKK